MYIVLQGNNISPFAQEIIPKRDDMVFKYSMDEYLPSADKQSLLVCPKCGGKLRKVKGLYGDFYGCSNYRTTGCIYKRKIWS